MRSSINDNIVFANRIINKTDRTLHMYEDTTGTVEHFEVSRRKLTSDPRYNMSHNSGSVFYVVSQKKFEQLAQSGRDVDDIAILLDNPTFGRNGKPIDYLVWGKDPKTIVRYKKLMFH